MSWRHAICGLHQRWPCPTPPAVAAVVLLAGLACAAKARVYQSSHRRRPGILVKLFDLIRSASRWIRPVPSDPWVRDGSFLQIWDLTTGKIFSSLSYLFFVDVCFSLSMFYPLVNSICVLMSSSLLVFSDVFFNSFYSYDSSVLFSSSSIVSTHPSRRISPLCFKLKSTPSFLTSVIRFGWPFFDEIRLFLPLTFSGPLARSEP